jgi:hypothetical protein
VQTMSADMSAPGLRSGNSSGFRLRCRQTCKTHLLFVLGAASRFP